MRPSKGFLSRFADEEPDTQTLSAQARVALGRGHRLLCPGAPASPSCCGGSRLSGAPRRRAVALSPDEARVLDGLQSKAA